MEPDLLATLRTAIRNSDMSYRRIGKRAGISHVAIIRFMRGNGLQTYTLKALARVLGYDITLVPKSSRPDHAPPSPEQQPPDQSESPSASPAPTG